MMKRIRTLVVVLICTLMMMAIVPVSAQSNITKDENVYAILDSEGKENEIIVSEWLHSDSGFSNYVDNTILKDVKALNSDNPITVSDQKITFNTKENDIYYQGNTDKALPFALNIKYYLDGKEYKAEDLTNKTGHLKISIKVENKLSNNQVLPLVIMTNLNNEEFSNITIDHGEIITDGMNQMLMMATIIGLKDITSDIDLIDVNEYLHDSFVIECDAKDMSVPSIMGASAFKNNISLDDFNIDTSTMDDDLNELKDATKEIVDGTTKLKEANEELASKMSEFQASVNEFKEGTASLKDNAKKLSDGMNQMDQGIQKLTATLNTLMAEVGKLSKEDSETLKVTLNGLLAKMPEIQSELGNMKAAIEASKGQLSNIEAVINASVTDDAYKGAFGLATEGIVASLKQGLSNGIDGAVDNISIDPTSFVNGEKVAELVALLVKDGTMTQEEATSMVMGILNTDAVNGLKDGIKGQLKTGVNTALDDAKGAITEANIKVGKGIVAGVAKGVATKLNDQITAMSSMLDTASAMLTNIGTSVNTVNGIIAKVDTQKILTILDGMMNDTTSLKTLQNASTTINNGLNSLYNGSEKIDNASQKILDATNQFKEATNTLKDKTGELNDGTIKFSKEGIDVLDEKLHDLLDKFTKIEDKLDLITANQNVYANYAGVSDGTQASVKFIFKTQEIQKALESSNQNTAEPVKEKMSFWERITNLFN